MLLNYISNKIHDTATRLLLREDDNAQKLVLQSLHRHREVDDRCLRADLWCVGGVAQLRGDVESELVHDVHLLVSNHHLEGAARLDEVLLKDVVQGGVKFLPHILYDERSTEGQRVLQMRSEVLVVQ